MLTRRTVSFVVTLAGLVVFTPLASRGQSIYTPDRGVYVGLNRFQVDANDSQSTVALGGLFGYRFGSGLDLSIGYDFNRQGDNRGETSLAIINVELAPTVGYTLPLSAFAARLQAGLSTELTDVLDGFRVYTYGGQADLSVFRRIGVRDRVEILPSVGVYTQATAYSNYMLHWLRAISGPEFGRTVWDTGLLFGLPVSVRAFGDKRFVVEPFYRHGLHTYRKGVSSDWKNRDFGLSIGFNF